MRKLFPLSAAVALVGCAVSFAQEAEIGAAKPRFAVLPPKFEAAPDLAEAGTPLPTWEGSFAYKGKTYQFTMVGAAPSANSTTTIAAIIIPLKIVITKGTTTTLFSPRHVLPNGKTVLENTIASPIFDSTTDYILGDVDLGATQYLDAYMRGNFWGAAGHPDYHLLLSGPMVRDLQTLSPPAHLGQAATVLGVKAAVVDVTWFETQLMNLLKSLKIPQSTLPIFLTYDTYLTDGGLVGCCIGGYHSYAVFSYGSIAYATATYVDKPGGFAQDVSALSHEVAEWAADPATNNPTPCGAGQVLEVGDPEEGYPNYGAFPYAVNGFSYNLQDLVFLPYFGAPATRSVNGWMTFQDNPFGLTVCSAGG
jgi:hypothetical protein